MQKYQKYKKNYRTYIEVGNQWFSETGVYDSETGFLCVCSVFTPLVSLALLPPEERDALR